MYKFRKPQYGDIIIFSYPKNKEKEVCTSLTNNITTKLNDAWNSRDISYLFKDDCKDFIKRIIGVGGGKIEIKNKTVYVNDLLLDEPYKTHRDLELANLPACRMHKAQKIQHHRKRGF